MKSSPTFKNNQPSKPMPCSCSHMEPSAREQESQRVCQLLAYALPLNGETVSADIKAGAASLYGRVDQVDELTDRLCKLCDTMPEPLKSKVIYDGRNPGARKLADWWDEHQKEDKLRKDKEATAARRAAIKAAAMAKLTPEEREVLGAE